MWPIPFLLHRLPLTRRWGPSSLFSVDPRSVTSAMPKVLWIELTSKCPYDCVFCTRRTRFGTGEHLDFEVYRSLIAGLESPEFIGLNYSGESLCYPRVIEAIGLANSTGASTELVTAFSCITGEMLRAIVASGLDRLAVSLHTMDERQYREIYRFGTLALLKERIAEFGAVKRDLGVSRPRLDFCFVAFHENLGQLREVALYAALAGASEIFVHPVIGRHPVPYDLSRELRANRLQESFKGDLRRAVADSRAEVPAIPITVLNPDIDPNPRLGREPAYYAPSLPANGRIHTCDQSPFESVHILANGDVVVCEVLDEMPLGNLRNQTLREIWHSGRYREFRNRYAAAKIPECRECVWKMAYLPARWKSRIIAADGRSPQLLRGWHLGERESVVWSKRESQLDLRSGGKSRRLCLAGLLARAPAGGTNTLRVFCGDEEIGRVLNPSTRELAFDEVFPLPVGDGPRSFRFLTEHAFRPASSGINSDTRDLAFALERAELLP